MACLTGLLAFSTSCKQNNEEGDMTITVSVPEMTCQDGERAYLSSDGTFYWEQSDQIKVYNLDENAANSNRKTFHNISGGPAERATFRGTSVGPKGSYGYRFFYPVEMATGTLAELQTNNHETFEVLDEQQYSYYAAPGHPRMFCDPASMPMAVQVAKVSAPNVNMQHMFGVVKIGLKVAEGVTKTVTGIEITDNHFNLTGTVSVFLPAVNTTTLNDLYDLYVAGNDADYDAQYASYVLGAMEWQSSPTGKTIYMNCVREGFPGVELYQPEEGGEITTWFNFILRPLALSQGFVLRVYFDDGSVLRIDKYSHPTHRDWAIQPGYYFQLPYEWGITSEGDIPTWAEAEWES